jgi:hypothetical protein
VVGRWLVLLARAAKATLCAVEKTEVCCRGYQSVSKLGPGFVKERPDRHRRRLALRPQRHRLRQQLVAVQIWILADESVVAVSTDW